MSLLLACVLGISSLCSDDTRVAVFDPVSDPDTLTANLADLGASSVERWPIAGWSIVTARRGESATDFAARIACDGRVPFVAPIYTSAKGGLVIATPDVLVRFVRGTSASTEEAVLASMSDFDVVERRFGAMDDAFRLHSRAHEADEVIAAANALARRRDVVPR
jgi:hypothetical protein